MANCEEIACANVQSAICLHCRRTLCVTHIVAHGMLLLKEGDQLCEEINELAEQLNVYLKQIHIAREEAVHKLNLWRQNQIDKVEHKYVEKVQMIEFGKDHLINLENKLTQRLTEEAKQPLEYMQTRQNANNQSLQIIRQAIENIAQDSTQLELCLKDSSSSVVNTSINPSDRQSIMTSQVPLNQTTSTIASNPISNQRTTMQRIITPSWTSKSTTTASAASTKNIKRPPTNPCRSLIKSFQNISGSSNHSIEQYIVKNLHRVVHVNNMMVLLLSFLEAWHSPKSSTVFNQGVLLYHINMVKKYIDGREHQLTVIAAIQVFVTSCNYNENLSGEIMTGLLVFFFNHQCISKEIVFDWYKNGAEYGYPGFHKAKLYAKSFIDQINTDIESK